MISSKMLHELCKSSILLYNPIVEYFVLCFMNITWQQSYNVLTCDRKYCKYFAYKRHACCKLATNMS